MLKHNLFSINEQKIFSDDLKFSTILKTEELTNPFNFRPITLLPILLNILEKLSNHQYGYNQ